MGIFDRYSEMFEPGKGGWKHRRDELIRQEQEYENQGYRPEEPEVQGPPPPPNDPLVNEVNQSKMMDVPAPQPTDWAARLGMKNGRLPLRRALYW